MRSVRVSHPTPEGMTIETTRDSRERVLTQLRLAIVHIAARTSERISA
jgi:hypothetical protein